MINLWLAVRGFMLFCDNLYHGDSHEKKSLTLLFFINEAGFFVILAF